MKDANLILLLLVLIMFSCTKNDSSISVPSVLQDSGIDLNMDRTKIENIIDKMNNPNKNNELVASHRGGVYWEDAPENTLGAFEKTTESGTDIIELDVRKTFDGHLVVIHDNDLDRTTNGSGKISERTLSYIKSLKTLDQNGSITNFSVPTLEEAMLFAKGKVLIMIDKANDYFKEVSKVLIKTKTIDHALFIESYQLIDAKEKMGDYLFKTSQYVPRIKETVDNIDRYINPFLSQKAASAFEIRFSTETSHTLEVIPKLKEQNKSIWVTTIDANMCANHDDELAMTNPDLAWGWCIENGANILLTDYPKKMVEYLIDKGLH